MKKRVALIEDHQVFRLGLKHLVEQTEEFEVVGEADCSASAIRLLAGVEVDLVLLDIELKDSEGLDLLRRIVGERPAAKVLVLTASCDAAFAERALDAGAQGYVDKLAGFDEVLCAVRSVAAGRTFVSVHESGRTVRRDPSATIAAPTEAAPTGDLSRREREVLQRIARGLTNQQTADELFLSVKTIETYRSRLTRKLGARGRAELFQAAQRAGLLAD